MQPPERHALLDLIARAAHSDRRFIADAEGRVALPDLHGASNLDTDADSLRGRAVLVVSDRQLPSVLALAELDGIARRLVLCPPDVAPAHMAAVIADAEVDAIVSDGTGPASGIRHGLTVRSHAAPVRPRVAHPRRDVDTEWLLFTSGTTGRPKLVVHTLPSLTGPVEDGVGRDASVWSTFYDVRRYGGLAIMMRALLGGGSLLLSQAGEPVGDFLARAGAAGVTHISGTPSHWRRALMTTAIGRLSPAYVRLSGEVADQAVLNSLRLAFPDAGVAHAFASTEAGVAFDVRDGLAGFPASLIGQPGAAVELRVRDGSLRIRSARTARGYAGAGVPALRDADGFVDTGDMVALRDGRYHFVGRREGVINVGGAKLHPEEIEAVINAHPDVRMSRVRGRPSPITGAIVVADIVARSADGALSAAAQQAILDECRHLLPAHKVPAMLRVVPSLDIAASGKLVRPRA